MSDTTGTKTALLPAEFADLERFSDWILQTEPERYGKRLASSMDEMQDLYDAVLEGTNLEGTDREGAVRENMDGAAG